MARRIFEEDSVMTGLCLWEAWLDWEYSTHAQYAELRETLKDIRGGVGSFALRQAMIDLIPTADMAWEAYVALHGGDPSAYSFDFDFIPEFLKGQIDNGNLDKVLETGQPLAA